MLKLKLEKYSGMEELQVCTECFWQTPKLFYCENLDNWIHALYCSSKPHRFIKVTRAATTSAFVITGAVICNIIHEMAVIWVPCEARRKVAGVLCIIKAWNKGSLPCQVHSFSTWTTFWHVFQIPPIRSSNLLIFCSQNKDRRLVTLWKMI